MEGGRGGRAAVERLLSQIIDTLAGVRSRKGGVESRLRPRLKGTVLRESFLQFDYHPPQVDQQLLQLDVVEQVPQGLSQNGRELCWVAH